MATPSHSVVPAKSDFGEGVVENGEGNERAAQHAYQSGDYFAPVGQHDGVVQIEVVHQQQKDANHQADSSEAIFVQQVDVGVSRRPRPKHHCHDKTECDK